MPLCSLWPRYVLSEDWIHQCPHLQLSSLRRVQPGLCIMYQSCLLTPCQETMTQLSNSVLPIVTAERSFPPAGSGHDLLLSIALSRQEPFVFLVN